MATVLTGLETLQVLGQNPAGVPAATTFQTTTGQIAALAATEGAPFIVTNITTVGNGTLTAAGLVGGEIVRSGPTGVYTDATDTAANIIAALPGAVVGSSFSILIKNTTAFTQTITAGTGVTLPPTVIVPAFAVLNYIATIATASTITIVHIDTVAIGTGSNITAPSATSITTVSNGTLAAAAFVGGLISRGGAQSGTAFTDTTDTASAIIAACANLVNKIGTSMLVEYSNTTNAAATITGGSGLTVSGVAVIPPNTIGQFLLTYTAANTMTMVGLGVTQNLATAITVLGSSTGSTAIQSANAGTTNYTATLPAATGTVAYSSPAPVAAGGTLAVTAAMSGAPILLNTAAGSVATLPAATGSGNIYNFFVTTTATSNAHKILAASVSDFMNGIVTGENAGTAKCFASAAATNHSLQMPVAGTQPSGGFIGDWFTITDVATNLWTVKGMYQAGTTPTTPFSAATS